ncbi:MAG: hypothetical protein F9K48_09925 [Candidatus Brocadia sp.]|nr:MAG: hypothetical protein F9K48_09925 [Candidatus Brocadia sp.]
MEPDKLYAVLPFSALAKSFQYPQTYNLEVAKVKYEHMPTTEQYFYVWSSLIAYRARQSNFFPRKTFVASEIFSHLVQNLLKSDLRIMLTYFVEFSRQINFSSALKREWNSQLGSIPSLATQRASENGKEIVKALKDAYLTEEAQTIENSLNLMNLAINNAQELAQLLNEAERAVKKLIDYSNTKNLEFNTNRKITELQYYLRFLRRDTEVKNSIAVLRSLLEDSKIKRKLWDLLNRL